MGQLGQDIVIRRSLEMQCVTTVISFKIKCEILSSEMEVSGDLLKCSIFLLL